MPARGAWVGPKRVARMGPRPASVGPDQVARPGPAGGARISNPHNIWQDVILGLDGYDEAATDQIDRGANDRFIAGDTMFVYSMQDNHWFTEAA